MCESVCASDRLLACVPVRMCVCASMCACVCVCVVH